MRCCLLVSDLLVYFRRLTPFVASQWQLAAWLLFWSLWLRNIRHLLFNPSPCAGVPTYQAIMSEKPVMAMRMAFLFMTSLMVPAVGLLSFSRAAVILMAGLSPTIT